MIYLTPSDIGLVNRLVRDLAGFDGLFKFFLKLLYSFLDISFMLLDPVWVHKHSLVILYYILIPTYNLTKLIRLLKI